MRGIEDGTRLTLAALSGIFPMIGLNALVSLLNLIAISIFVGEYYTDWRQRRKVMMLRSAVRKKRVPHSPVTATTTTSL